MPATSAAPRAIKKEVVETSRVSAPSQSVKKRLQESHIDQQLLELEHDDGTRHSKELTLCLNEYAKKINQVQEKNRRLEKELAVDDHAANAQTKEKSSTLYVQGNNFMTRLKLEQKELARLNALIQSHESILAQQNLKLHELAALDHNHAIMLGRVRKMEHDIDRRIVKMNENLNRNRELRKIIDAHRTERARMDNLYTKISIETLSKKHKIVQIGGEVEKLRQEVKVIEQELEDVRKEGEEWERKCDRRAAVLLQELKEAALHQKDAKELVSVGKYKLLGENDIMKTVSEADESVGQSRSKWKNGQVKVTADAMLSKYQENRMYIEKIQEASGTTTVSEMIEAFNNQEAEHFDRIQHVNRLAEEIENHRQVSAKLREEIGRLKQRKDSVDFQRINRIESLRLKLQHTNEQKKLKEGANHEMQTLLDAVKPAVLLFHSRIGCLDVHNDATKQVLGAIEGQIVTILQSYHAKVEAAKKDEVSIQTVTSTNLSQTSPRKHKSSVAVSARSRRSNVVIKATEGANNRGEAVRTGSATAASPMKTAHHASTIVAPVADNLSPTIKTPKTTLSKEQPYRYAGLRPPHMSMEELRKIDNVEEEYPLNYHELKVKVWHSDSQ